MAKAPAIPNHVTRRALFQTSGKVAAAGALASLPAAPAGTPLISHKPPGAGFATRTIPDKLRDWPTIKDFGAKGDRVPALGGNPQFAGTDDTAAWNAVVAYAVETGNPVLLPSGAYRLTAGAVVSLPATVGLGNAGRTFSIIGAGASNTVLYLDSAAAGDFIDIRSPNIAVLYSLRLSGFRVEREFADHSARLAFAAMPNGAAIKLSNLADWVIDDVKVSGFEKGIELAGSLNGVVSNYLANVCKIGYLAYPFNAVDANQNKIFRSAFLANRDFGIKQTGGNGLHLDQVSIEGTGERLTSTKGTPILLRDMGASGASALSCSGSVYFENTFGDQVVKIVHTRPAIYDFAGCNFNRIGATEVVVHDILFDASGLGAGGAKAVVDVSRASFNSLARYVNTAPNRRVEFVSKAGYDGLTYMSDGAVGLDGVDAPIPPPAALWLGSPSRVWAASVTPRSATGFAGTNIATVAKGGTGVYLYILRRAAPSNPVVMVTLNADGRAFVTSASASGFTVNTVNPAGALADIAHNVMVAIA